LTDCLLYIVTNLLNYIITASFPRYGSGRMGVETNECPTQRNIAHATGVGRAEVTPSTVVNTHVDLTI
jgi:hypothetical protein